MPRTTQNRPCDRSSLLRPRWRRSRSRLCRRRFGMPTRPNPAIRRSRSCCPYTPACRATVTPEPGLAVSTGRPAQEPADRPTAAAVPPAAVTAAVSDPPNDYVPREPGSIHGSAPAAPPVPAPVASPAAPMPKDATALVIASLPQARPATPRCAAGATRKSCAHAGCCAPGCRCRGGRSSASACPADTSAGGPYRRSEPASWSDVATRAGPGSQPGH